MLEFTSDNADDGSSRATEHAPANDQALLDAYSNAVIGVNSGPAVTQYELQPGVGVPVRKITALQNDLSLALSAAIRIQGRKAHPSVT